jgi:hypothetical protein
MEVLQYLTMAVTWEVDGDRVGLDMDSEDGLIQDEAMCHVQETPGVDMIQDHDSQVLQFTS